MVSQESTRKKSISCPETLVIESPEETDATLTSYVISYIAGLPVSNQKRQFPQVA